MRISLMLVGGLIGAAASASALDMILTVRENTLHRFNGQTGEYLGQFGIQQEYPGAASSMAVFRDRTEVAIYSRSDLGQTRIARYNYNSGEFLGSFLPTGADFFSRIEYDQSGNLLVTTNSSSYRGTRRYTPSGSLAGAGLQLNMLNYEAVYATQLSNGIYYQAANARLNDNVIQSNRISRFDTQGSLVGETLMGDENWQIGRRLSPGTVFGDDILIANVRPTDEGRLVLLRKRAGADDLDVINSCTYSTMGLYYAAGQADMLLGAEGRGYIVGGGGPDSYPHRNRIYRVNYMSPTLNLSDVYFPTQLPNDTNGPSALVVVPEPACLLTLGVGLFSMTRRRRRETAR